jgi:F420H(2)-dependent biliverdin reductase
VTTTERFLRESNVWLATVRPSGRPHLVPIWFTWVEKRIWIATQGDSVKVRNLAHNPTASVSLQDGDRPVVAEGTASVHLPPFANVGDLLAVQDAFVEKYKWDFVADSDRPVLLEIVPAKWVFPSYETDAEPPR